MSDIATCAKSKFRRAANSAAKAFLEVCVPDRARRRALKGRLARFWLEKHVERVAAKPRTSPPPAKRENAQSVIWQYWEQGEAEMPPLVRVCAQSVEKFGGAKRVFLSAKNVEDFVEIPARIYDLKRRGAMGTAHFSDILRASLLVQSGGTWIDSTVLLTDFIPQSVMSSDLFVFQNDPAVDGDGLNMASYFMHSVPNEKIISDALGIIFDYWKDNDFLANYFLFLHAFTMATRATPQNAALWKKVPNTSFLPVQELQQKLALPFDSAEWARLKKNSFAHKLSHKQKVVSKLGNHNAAGTFYDVLIRKGGAL